MLCHRPSLYPRRGERSPSWWPFGLLNGVYAVASKRRLTTRGGKPYPRSSSSTQREDEGRVWNDVELLDRGLAGSDVVRVLGRVERFDGRLQLAVRTVEAADVYLAMLAPTLRRDVDELEAFLDFFAVDIAHPGACRGPR